MHAAAEQQLRLKVYEPVSLPDTHARLTCSSPPRRFYSSSYPNTHTQPRTGGAYKERAGTRESGRGGLDMPSTSDHYTSDSSQHLGPAGNISGTGKVGERTYGRGAAGVSVVKHRPPAQTEGTSRSRSRSRQDEIVHAEPQQLQDGIVHAEPQQPQRESPSKRLKDALERLANGEEGHTGVGRSWARSDSHFVDSV
jgi:hypothetical protein